MRDFSIVDRREARVQCDAEFLGPANVRWRWNPVFGWPRFIKNEARKIVLLRSIESL